MPSSSIENVYCIINHNFAYVNKNFFAVGGCRISVSFGCGFVFEWYESFGRMKGNELMGPIWHGWRCRPMCAVRQGEIPDPNHANHFSIFDLSKTEKMVYKNMG